MRILILTNKYFPMALINAICVQNVANELLKNGNVVDILAFKDTKITGPSKYNGVNVYYVKPDVRTQLFYYSDNFPQSRYSRMADRVAKFMNRSKKLLMLPFFPVYSFSCPKRIQKQMEKLHQKNHYDLVLSVYCPFDCALAAMWFKNKHPDVKWCLYMLDTFINQRYRFLNRIGNNNKWIYRFLEKTDMFIYMLSRKKEYADDRFDKWRHKMYISDIPLLIKGESRTKLVAHSDVENWVYAGSLDNVHYRTEDLIMIFLALPKDRKRVLHFYSMGSELDKIAKIERETQGIIKAHRYVPHDELEKIYSTASVLVSMKYTDQISAKIFEYMTYKKTIVHISGCPNDTIAGYVKRYPKGCVVTTYDCTIEHCAEEVYKKINEYRNLVEQPDVFDLFVQNKPEYTAEIIMRRFKEAN